MFPTLHQLQIFATVARRQSFARAAEELFLSAPSVSLQVQRLEQHYGVRLFDRTSHGPVLTRAGEILLGAAESVFDRLQAASREIERIKPTDSYQLGIGATVLAGIYQLPLALAIFRRRFPQVELNLLLAEPEQIEEALLRHTIEVGVTGRDVRSSHLCSEPFVVEPLELFVNLENPLAAFESVPREALAEQTLIMREMGSRTREVVEQAIATHDLRFANIVQARGVEGVTKAIVENRGVGFGLVATNQIELQRGQIVRKRIVDVDLGVRFDLIYRANQDLSSAALSFIACCRETLPSQ